MLNNVYIKSKKNSINLKGFNNGMYDNGLKSNRVNSVTKAYYEW